MPAFDPELLALYTLAALALAATPGPDMLFCFASGVAGGPRAGLAAAAGIGAALAVHLTALTLGLAGLVAASPVAFDTLRWAGGLYLLWLAWQAFRAPPPALRTAAGREGREDTAADLRAVFRRGVVTCLLNPKLLLFMLAFLPQFVRPEAGPVAAQFFILGLILMVPGLFVNAAVGYGGGGLGQWLLRNPKIAWLQNRIVGTIFAGLAARLLIGAKG